MRFQIDSDLSKVQFDEILSWHKDQDEKEKTQSVKTEISDK